jgi:hypothetical protein
MFCGWVTSRFQTVLHREDEPDLSHRSRRDHRLISRHASQYSLRTNEPWYPEKPVNPTTLSSHIPPYLAYRKLPSENVNEFRRLALLINHILHGESPKVVVLHDERKTRTTKVPYRLASSPTFFSSLSPK